jgi:hypothetical protein
VLQRHTLYGGFASIAFKLLDCRATTAAAAVMHAAADGFLVPQVSHVVVSTLDALWLAPKGLKDVHNMLRNVARSLVAGGKTGVFSPMHMLVFQKPK